MISGLYDLPQFAANARSPIAKEVVAALKTETGGAPQALRERSVLLIDRPIRASALILNGAKDDRTDPAQARTLADRIQRGGGHALAII